MKKLYTLILQQIVFMLHMPMKLCELLQNPLSCTRLYTIPYNIKTTQNSKQSKQRTDLFPGETAN